MVPTSVMRCILNFKVWNNLHSVAWNNLAPFSEPSHLRSGAAGDGQ